MNRRYRSLFWPAILILVGVFALLVNVGLVPVDRLDRLVDLWPLILVVIGLELVVRRALQGVSAEIAAALIVLLAIGGAAAYVALGPSTPTGIQTLDTAGKIGSLNHAAVPADAVSPTVPLHGNNPHGTSLLPAHTRDPGP